MKNANYKIMEKPLHDGGTWYAIYRRAPFVWAWLGTWEYIKTEETLERAERWIGQDKLQKAREKNPCVRYYA